MPRRPHHGYDSCDNSCNDHLHRPPQDTGSGQRSSTSTSTASYTNSGITMGDRSRPAPVAAADSTCRDCYGPPEPVRRDHDDRHNISTGFLPPFLPPPTRLGDEPAYALGSLDRRYPQPVPMPPLLPPAAAAAAATVPRMPTEIPMPVVHSMEGIYAYCFDRGGGRFTPLIPADALPLAGIVPFLPSREGMIVLTDPLRMAAAQALLPPMPASPTPPVARFLPQCVLAQAGPAHHPLETLSMSVSAAPPTPITPIPPLAPIAPIAPITPMALQPNRRVKVYCDKWVHEGICAFTQQGCKFKHEMPHDRATQQALGLFHGYPAWYKKTHMAPGDSASLDGSRPFPFRAGVSSWRQQPSMPSMEHNSPETVRLPGGQPTAPFSFRHHRQPYGRDAAVPLVVRDYGPIAPPSASFSFRDSTSQDICFQAESSDVESERVSRQD